jgi:hypothetical protein
MATLMFAGFQSCVVERPGVDLDREAIRHAARGGLV